MLKSWFVNILQPRKLNVAAVLDERIRLESISTAIGAIGVMIIAVVMYLIFPNDMPQASYIGIWLSAQLIAGFAWLGFMVWYMRYHSLGARYLWPYLSSLICSFYGFIWGAGWVFFVGKADIAHAQAAVIFTIILGGVFTGGVLATIFHLPSLLSFTFCSLFPPLVSTLVNDGIFHIWFGLSLVIYMLASTAFALNLHTFLLDTLEQREDKALLAKQLEIEKQRVEQTSQEKTRFLAAVSHDLRQPLQALQFFQQSLESVIAQGNNIEQQRILDGMAVAIDALNGLLNAMLDISHLETGILPFHSQAIPLSKLFRRVYQQYEPIASEMGISLRYVDTHLYIESDPTHLERILRNLIENAIKHMGKEGKVLLGIRRKKQFLNIEVWDNGVGIPLEQQESIFQEFYQIHNIERKRSQGFGLGLAIVKRTAAALGHEIGLRSYLGKGSVFSIKVPIAESNTLKIETITPCYPPITDKEKGKILIIEDDETVLDSLRTLLTLEGHTVIATTIPDPLTLIDQHPDIKFIISDYQLSSGVNGVDIIQKMRKIVGYDIPALLITGNTSPLLAEELEKLSIPVSYKPINPFLLKNFIKIYN